MFTATDCWVVRCPPAKTLEVVAQLTALGFTAWTPVVEREYRKARSKKYIRVPEAMLSSFVFVEMGDNPTQCAERLDDLRWLLQVRLWRVLGKYAPVSSVALQPLRDVEREAATFGIDNLISADTFVIGDKGTLQAAAFLGLTCTLVGRTRGNLLVLLEGAQNPITIKAQLFVPADK